jgi:hypothetical protein
VRRHSSWFSSGLVLGALVLGALAGGHARAQACCAGSSALTPARLGIHEDAAVGAILRGSGVLGSLDSSGRYFANPAGTAELDGEADLVGTLRVFRDAQITALVPFPVTWRKIVGRSELGGGLGDVNVSGRYDFTHAGQSMVMPGIAVLVGVTFPTGRSPDDASRPLSTDATGIGAFQLTGGVALEQSFGHFLLNLTVLAAWRTPRSVRGVTETLGVQLQGLLGVGYAFDSGASLAVSVGQLGELDAVLAGKRLPGSGRGRATIGLAGALPLAERWRLQGSLTYNPPVLGWNHSSSLGFTVSLLRLWA